MKKEILLTLITCAATLSIVAQDIGNDITVKFSQAFQRSNESIIGLEYRRDISSNFKMKLGTNYGKSNKSVWVGNPVIFGSDSIIINRDLASFSTNYSFYAGVDYEGIDYLSFGASLVFGTNETIIGAFDQGARYDPEEGWVNCIECVYEYNKDELITNETSSVQNRQYATAIKTTNYFVYGLSLRAAIRIPIKKRFELTTGFEPTFVRYKSIDEVEYHPIKVNPTGVLGDNFELFTYTATMALRYKF